MTDWEFEEHMSVLGRHLPANAAAWLRQHPEFITDDRRNRELGKLHTELVDTDLQPFSSAYFDALDQRFGFKAELGDEGSTLQ